MAGIYIHIPFCRQACHYCNFHFSTSLRYREELISCLIKELILRKQEIHTPIETIYFGGGTPSLLPYQDIDAIINTIYKHYQVSKDPEVTLEVNPDDVFNNDKACESTFLAYKKIGVNRLSIGVQSFFDRDLKLMNRAHNVKESLKCLSDATHYFDNISVDLIYGIPGLTNDEWLENIDNVLQFNINHISCYALTVEPKTALDTFIKKGKISPVDDDLAESQFYIALDKLEKKGFINYEISNFGKDQYFSRNNTAYWQGKPYLGIGPSAHSFNGIDVRSWNIANNKQYIKSLTNSITPTTKEHLSITDRYNEFVMTGLRTIWGVSLNKITDDFGISYRDYLLKNSEEHINKGLLIIKNDTLSASKQGKFLTDGIASKLFKIHAQ